MNSSSKALQNAALALVKERGWFVYPATIGHDESRCDGGTHNCKTVSMTGSWEHGSSNDPDTVSGWDWTRANAYAIDCGKSGIVVVDQDPGADWPFTDTRVHSSGRGKHYFYEDLLGMGNKARLAPWGVDVRGVGGIVFGPGSYHPHGPYAVLRDVDPAGVPGALLQASKPRSRPVPEVVAGPLEPLEAIERLEGVYRAMEAVPDGMRNDRLNVLAGTAAGLWVRVEPGFQIGVLDEDHIKTRLLESVTGDGNPAKSRNTIRSGWEYGLSNPVGDDFAVEVGFFDETPVLSTIRQFAHAQGVSSVLLLGNILLRVAAQLPPGVMQIPAVVGSRKPLNFGLLAVGGSSAGKSASFSTGRDCFGTLSLDQKLEIERQVGSGEGLAETFLEDEMIPNPSTAANAKPFIKSGRKVVIKDARRLVYTDEIGDMAATQAREGSKLSSVIRKGVMGESLGEENASADRRRNVPEGSYRLAMFMGVQPERSDVLLNEEKSGTPQRFLWLPSDDPTAPTRWQDAPERPEPLDWFPPRHLPETFDYPEHVKQEVKQARFDALHKTGDEGLAGHNRLLRIKTAALLALLHGEVEVTDQWWRIAGMLTDLSLAVQAECKRVLSSEVQNRANSRAITQNRAIEAADTDMVKRASKSILGALVKAEGKWLTRHQVRPGTKSLREPEVVDAAIIALVNANQAEIKEETHPQHPGETVTYLRAVTK